MKLQKNLWIAGGFYVDIDPLGQLRVVGPGNHLFYGTNGLYEPDFSVESVEIEDGQLRIILTLQTDGELHLLDPIVAHIRRVRQYCELDGQAVPTYASVSTSHPEELLPNLVSIEDHQVTYRRRYGQDWYGVRMVFPDTVEIQREEAPPGLVIRGSNRLRIEILTDCSRVWSPQIAEILVPGTISGNEQLSSLAERAATEIAHLVSTNKTSGFEYGTVFPRDWLESINLGGEDLTPEARLYMFRQSLQHVNDEGAGWHEEIVGEFKAERAEELDQLSLTIKELLSEHHTQAAFNKALAKLRRHQISRQMIDIEPLYILTLRLINPARLNNDDIDRLRRIADYLLQQALARDLITFKEMPALLRRHRHDRYYHDGNWRDSRQAYQGIRSNIAPYDVNVVFYPEALKLLRQFSELLKINVASLEAAIAKWSFVKEHYRFANADGSSAYALALYDISDVPSDRYQKLLVNHLDESYELFYGAPEPSDVESFCRRLLSSDYFYTASGPLLVGRSQGYNHTQYHGEVIWTKQTAFTVAGLERQLVRAREAHWPADLITLIRQALTATIEASLRAFETLGAVPELHYDLSGVPHFYNDLPNAEGVMNLVQLWSAVGARRIIRAQSNLTSGAARPSGLGHKAQPQHQHTHQPTG